ncbi:MAG TPA: hypothetical protein VG245_09820 [Candidatus Dormibacteraeota bacterium]|jgi:hypothetical protein|nr:hypothetical protein [Candidatus Dormibacteraeota bacterium]
MSHKGADHLSESIDRWLGAGAGGGGVGHLADVLGALSDAFPEVSDELAKERVRRRLAGFNPRSRTPQELLVERAADSVERIGRSLAGEGEYLPWPTIAGAAAVLVVAAVALAWLRRRGLDPAATEA